MKSIKTLLVALMAVIAILAVTETADATPITQEQAVSWAKSRGQTKVGLNYDKAYGNQCVDLIYYYYTCLGVPSAGGNACDYINNKLPSGWKRISSNIVPQPGDIAVFKTYLTLASGKQMTGQYGHIGIVTSGNSSTFSLVHQNANGKKYCFEESGYSTSYLACVIRPNFSTTNTLTVSWNPYAEKHQIGKTNAVLASQLNLNADISAINRVGLYLYDSNGTQLATTGENAGIAGQKWVGMWYDVNAKLNYTLKAGTQYKYKFYAVIYGKTYYSPVYNFTTGGTHIHAYDGGIITNAPTCTATGTKIYTCTICGDTKTETIAKIQAHTYTDDSDTNCDICGAYAYPGGNTLVKENGIWYHVVNRQKVNDTTLVYYGGYWFYVKNGEVDWTSNTLCKWNGMWFHVKDGKKVNDTTLVKYGGYWFYVKDGQVDFNATTLCYYGGYWFYVKNGEVDWTSNTLCKWNGMWFHVKDGKKVNDTTLVKYGGYWFYVKDGQVDFNATTLCYYGGYWFYVKNGEVDWTSKTLCKWNGMWFHVKDGKKVNDTTLVKYGGYWFYVKDGQVDFNATTLCYYGGYWFYVKNGEVDWESNTLCKWNGMWFHVKDGKKVNDTTLVYYGGYWFYVKDGQVDFNYSGKVLYNGRYYTVQSGMTNIIP